MKKKRREKPPKKETARAENIHHRKVRQRPEKRVLTRAEQKRRAQRFRRDSLIFELIYRLILTTAVAFAVLFAATAFFKIRDIKVIGSEKYSPAIVAQASGIKKGDNLFFINQFETADRLFSELSYIDKVKVRQKPPSTAVLEITESVPRVVLECGHMSYVLDEKCKLLEFMPSPSGFDLPVISGLNVSPNSVPGREIAFGDDITLSSLRSIVEILLPSTQMSHLGTIYMDKLYEIYFIYDNKYRVILGDTSELEKKLEYLDDVVKRLDGEPKGTINIKNPERITYRPGTQDVETIIEQKNIKICE